jgi:hypothetical protein
MSTPTIAAANGRARKSLEGQLDQFDRILDGLADALNGSVADAVKDAVGAVNAQAAWQARRRWPTLRAFSERVQRGDPQRQRIALWPWPTPWCG